MKCDFQTASGIDQHLIKSTIASLDPYRKQLAKLKDQQTFREPEALIQLPFDHTSIAQIIKQAKQKSSKDLRYVVVIGIGGSNLGTQALYDALGTRLEMIFLDTVSARSFQTCISRLNTASNKEAFVIISISKSGKTTETAANTEAVLSALRHPFGDVRDRLVVITEKNSPFWQTAVAQHISCLEIPSCVSGRYSVMSAVGLFPLALAGLDIKSLINGAQASVKDGTSGSWKTNHAIISAAITHQQTREGRDIHNTFFFAPELESLGKWYRQLMAESLGKDGQGILPIISIGSTDMHSMAQLYYGGPDRVFTQIVTYTPISSPRLPKKLQFSGLVEHLENKSLGELMQAIASGTARTYQHLMRPLVTIHFEQLNAYELGYYLQFRMLEVMYLAQLMHVNAFDQPMVEQYKKETTNLLKK